MPANDRFPLLVLPSPRTEERAKRGGGGGTTHFPSSRRQAERLGAKLESLQEIFQARAMQVRAGEEGIDPEQVLVLETVGLIPDFIVAVRRIPGMEWLVEWEEEEIEPDRDFFDERDPQKLLNRRLFLVMSNQAAIQEFLDLWRRRNQPFPRGYANWKHLFAQLRDVRFWDERDRLEQDVLDYWREVVAAAATIVRFEIEIWHFQSPQKNDQAMSEVSLLLKELGGRVISRALLPQIAYHAALVELPIDAIQRILNGDYPRLVLSTRVMFFRPVTLAMSVPTDNELAESVGDRPIPQGVPVVALLDGLPLENHQLLAGRLVVDDPDNWSAVYPAQDRVHGTAMASVILHGDLNAPPDTLGRRIYVRPILRPDPKDFHTPRIETTPDDVLLIDLVHGAVRRLFEQIGSEPPVAPSIRVINLSVGDETRLFDRKLSPWARLVDWLSWRYGVLFCISSGNAVGVMPLKLARIGFDGIPLPDKQAGVLDAMLDEHLARRLIAPADAINAITVGGIHDDNSTFVAVADRFEPVPRGSPSPVTRVGHGYRRAIKPDVLAAAGRCLYRESIINRATTAEIQRVDGGAPPGHRTASPGGAGLAPSATKYSRGTSNATALVSRLASKLYDVIEGVRQAHPQALPRSHDAVILKAGIVHCAEWGDLAPPILAARPAIVDSRRKKELVARWIGFGRVHDDRIMYCTSERATAVGIGTLSDGEGVVFRFPLPPSLSGPRVYRRLTITLAWLSPANNAHQAYRRARLWFQPPAHTLRVERGMGTPDYHAVQRGTVQHEVLHGESAATFVDGEVLEVKVNCASDAGKLEEEVKFALCVSLEVAEGVEIPVYAEVAARIAVPVRARARV